MSLSGRRAVQALILAIAFIIQAAFSNSLTFRSARPNIALTVLLIECLYAGANTAAALGFLLGLLEASYSAVYVGSLIVTRSLAGYFVGSLEDRIFRDNLLIALATVLSGTAATESLFFLFVPQPHFSRWAVATAGECLYNGALAVPIFVLVRRVLRVRSTE